eukprot:TRINITY_DN55182_c0_g1_i1.p1 TRINITY_DN55182_c0_g1~~TRINITY_DN55182_c0_g1_i1.p1  ORF type:complete len:686 (-),score=123.61 TRINITY_DN55182_c0_g1_i1:53-2110(-)
MVDAHVLWQESTDFRYQLEAAFQRQYEQLSVCVQEAVRHEFFLQSARGRNRLLPELGCQAFQSTPSVSADDSPSGAFQTAEVSPRTSTSAAHGQDLSHMKVQLQHVDSCHNPKGSKRRDTGFFLEREARGRNGLFVAHDPDDVGGGGISHLEAFVESPTFDGIVFAIIVASLVSLGVEAEYSVKPDSDAATWLSVVEVVFCVLFTVEIVLKVSVRRVKFFYDRDRGWNLFSVLLLLLQLFELVLDAVLSTSDRGSADVLLRLIRILRVARIGRALRVFSIIHGLRTIVASVLGTLRHVFWTIMALFTGVYAVAICVTQMAADVQKGCNAGEVDLIHCPDILQEYFGSLFRSCMTLFAAVSGGVDWIVPLLLLQEHVSLFGFFLAFMYVTFVVFALVNAVTGVFVDSAMRAADKSQAQALTGMADSIFAKTDKECVGSIGRAEFMSSLKGSEMKQYFMLLDVSLNEAEKLFDIIDSDRSGTIEIQEFIDGVLRLKGPAKSLDFWSFLTFWRDSHEMLREEMKALQDVIRSVSHDDQWPRLSCERFGRCDMGQTVVKSKHPAGHSSSKLSSSSSQEAAPSTFTPAAAPELNGTELPRDDFSVHPPQERQAAPGGPLKRDGDSGIKIIRSPSDGDEIGGTYMPKSTKAFVARSRLIPTVPVPQDRHFQTTLRKEASQGSSLAESDLHL